MATASEAVSTTASTSTAKEVGKASKGKAEDKKRREKDFDSDSNDQQQREKQMAIKREDTEDDSQMTGPSSIMEGESSDEGSISNKVDESEIAIGDGLKVKYGRGKQLEEYEAKVLKSEYDVTKNLYKYLVHYYGWSSRYDEWIYRNRIVQVIRDISPRLRSGMVKNKGEPLPVDANICIDDEDDDEDNKIEVVVRSHTKSESSMSNIRSSRGLLQPPPNEPPPTEKRNRVKDEPKQERYASMEIQQQSAKKEKVSPTKAEVDAGGRNSMVSGPGSSSKRAKVQSSQASASKEKDAAKSSSKMQIKKSDSDDESSRMASTSKGSSTSKSKDKKKTPAEKTAKQVDTPATRKDGKRTESNKRTAAEATIFATDVSKEDSALVEIGSLVKKQRIDEKTNSPQSKASMAATAENVYEFVGDGYYVEQKMVIVDMGKRTSMKSGGGKKKKTKKRGSRRSKRSSKKAKTAAASTLAVSQPELEEEKPTSTKSDGSYSATAESASHRIGPFSGKLGDSDADSKRYARKVEPPVVASARKLRAICSESKVSSSSSPVAAGILSSQDSSQDGDDRSIDEELQKMVAKEKKLRNKTAAAARAKCSDLNSKNDNDSMSGSQSRLANRNPSDRKSFKSPAPSPKKRHCARMYTISQSENCDGGDASGTPYSEGKEHSPGYTRGRYRHNVASSSLHDTANMYSTGGGSSASCSSSNIQAIIANLKAPDPMPFDYSIFAAYDQNKYPYMAPLDVEKMPPEQRINILLERMEYVRKTYFDVKAKMVETERKKKRALQKKKDRERKEQRELAKAANAAAAALANLQASGSDSSSSSSKNERSSRSSTRQRDNGGTASGRSSARLEEAAAAGSDGGSKNKEESPT